MCMWLMPFSMCKNEASSGLIRSITRPIAEASVRRLAPPASARNHPSAPPPADALRRSPIERSAYDVARYTAGGADVPVVPCRPGEHERTFQQREQRHRHIARPDLGQTGLHEVRVD